MNHSNLSGQDGHYFRDENKYAETSVNSLNTVSLAAILRVLIAKGYVTHEEIMNSEKELQNHREAQIRPGEKKTTSDVRDSDLHFVRTYSSRERKPVRFRMLRKIMGKYKWSRKIAAALFGWKWRRKTPDKYVDVLDR
jgi:hypothetical protein